MEHQLKIRIETGPGIPFDLSKLAEPDARRAIMQAVAALLTAEDHQAAVTYTGQSGVVTASFYPTDYAGGSDGRVPATNHYEVIGTVRIGDGSAE